MTSTAARASGPTYKCEGYASLMHQLVAKLFWKSLSTVSLASIAHAGRDECDGNFSPFLGLYACSIIDGRSHYLNCVMGG